MSKEDMGMGVLLVELDEWQPRISFRFGKVDLALSHRLFILNQVPAHCHQD